MRVVDHRTPWLLLAWLIFTGLMAAVYLLQRGFGQDFGVGFSVGLVVGIILVTAAVGWRRGEFQKEEPDQLPRRLP